MLIDFFLHLKERRLPVTITEYLALLEALQAGLAHCSVDDFYTLSRICLVKNEAHYDRFDVAFAEYFERIQGQENGGEIPAEWLEPAKNKPLSPEELAMLDIPLAEETLRLEPLQEEKPLEDDRGKLKGSSGNHPLGLGGIPPDELPQEKTVTDNKKASKAWENRQFQDLDADVELGTRNIKMALRRLRKFAREGVPDELDLEETIRKTARNAGWLDLVMRPERKNRVKVLLLFDRGGSMVPYVKQCEELFSAARTEFKHMDYFYYHNCVYDAVWKYDGPSSITYYSLHTLINKFGKDYKLIFVGDATMGPVEITDPGRDFFDTENVHSGETAMKTLLSHFRHAVWLNPEQERFWSHAKSIEMIHEIMEKRMFPLTLRGLDDAMRSLGK